MNLTKPIFDERDQLRRQLIAAEEALTQVQRANAELRDCLAAAERQYAALEQFVGVPQAKLVAEIERMRRVCEAAVTLLDRWEAYGAAVKSYQLAGNGLNWTYREIAKRAYNQAVVAHDEAVRDYRKRQEAE